MNLVNLVVMMLARPAAIVWCTNQYDYPSVRNCQEKHSSWSGVGYCAIGTKGRAESSGTSSERGKHARTAPVIGHATTATKRGASRSMMTNLR